MIDECTSQSNLLIAALPLAERQMWMAHLEPVQMQAGEVLQQPGTTPTHAYFPVTAPVSLLQGTQDGASTEVAMVGREGMIDTSLFLGGEASGGWASVQAGGLAYRVPAPWLLTQFERNGALRHLLLRYTQALMAQMAQTAVCNRHHTLSQRLCRWLLQNLDQAPRGELRVTQEVIAVMLGVRREGVTEALGRLQHDGAIRCARGKIRVLDRALLVQRSCECYGVVKDEMDRMLPSLA